MKTLTEKQALQVAFEFLEERAKRTTYETELGAVIGDMCIISEEGEEVETSDPAIWEDWQDAVNKVLNNEAE